MEDINPYESPQDVEPLDAYVLDENEDPALKCVYRALAGVSLTVLGIIGVEGYVKGDAQRLAMVAMAGAGFALSAQHVDANTTRNDES